MFKLPNHISVATMRQKPNAGPQKLSLIRPSSGYYGYNSRRTDSDTESAHFSSTNVCIQLKFQKKTLFMCKIDSY